MKWSLALLLLACVTAHAQVWQPSAGHTQVPIWPGTPPNAQPMPGPEYGKADPKSHAVIGAYNVSRPTMTVYAPKGKNTGAAVVVFRAAASRCSRWRSKAPRSATG